MANIQNLFDAGQGKSGNLVVYNMNGQSILRTKPEHYSDRKTPAQLAQQNYFMPELNALQMRSTAYSSLQTGGRMNKSNCNAASETGIQQHTVFMLLSR